MANILPTMTTGGNLPANLVPNGGGLQALSLNGANYVANPTAPAAPAPAFSPANVVNGMSQQIGTGLDSVTPGTAIGNLTNQFNTAPTQTAAEAVQGINGAFQNPALPSATQVTTSALDELLGKDNPYIANARRRGLEHANSRGMLNASIGAGASQRAAIESSMPILNQIMGLTAQREGQDFQANQQSREQAVALSAQREQQLHQQSQAAFEAAAQLTGQDRQNAFANAQNLLNQATDLQKQREGLAFQSQENAADRVQQVNRDMLGAQLTDWMASENFTREFNGQLATMPIKNAMDLTNAISQYAMENPELYTPELVSGMSNFLNMNMVSILQTFFPGMNTGGTA